MEPKKKTKTELLDEMLQMGYKGITSRTKGDLQAGAPANDRLRTDTNELIKVWLLRDGYKGPIPNRHADLLALQAERVADRTGISPSTPEAEARRAASERRRAERLSKGF